MFDFDFRKGWTKWWRIPSYLYARWKFKKSSNWDLPICPCIDGSNDFYWNGWFKPGKDCECGG